MKLQWKQHAFVLTEIDAFAVELIKRLPGCASTDDSAVTARLFPSPTGGKEEEADADWRETVEPELRDLFASHVDKVVQDLTQLKEEEPGEEKTEEAEEPNIAEEEDFGGSLEPSAGSDEEAEAEELLGELPSYALEIPAAHAHAWIHTLNQARLALGERHHLTEENLEYREFPEDQQDVLAMIQVDFYGRLLGYLLHHTEL